MGECFLHGNGAQPGINIKIVGGTIQPSTATDNTIWVNTDANVSGCIISPTKPQDITTGMVWLESANAGSEVYIGNSSKVLLHISGCYLYKESVWTPVDGMLYSSESWKAIDTTTYLIKNGDMAMVFNVTDNVGIVQNTGCVEIYGKSGYGLARVDDIDLTDKTTITVEGIFDTTVAYDSGIQAAAFYIGIWEKTDTSNKAKACVYYRGDGKGSVTSFVLDVKNFIGAYKVGISTVANKHEKITKFEIK